MSWAADTRRAGFQRGFDLVDAAGNAPPLQRLAMILEQQLP
jgi:hypothetical protein